VVNVVSLEEASHLTRAVPTRLSNQSGDSFPTNHSRSLDFAGSSLRESSAARDDKFGSGGGLMKMRNRDNQSWASPPINFCGA
jgi:hypothetical protein